VAEVNGGGRGSGTLGCADQHGNHVTGVDCQVRNLHFASREPLMPRIDVAGDGGAAAVDLAFDARLADVRRVVSIDPDPTGAVVPLVLRRCVDVRHDPITLNPLE